MSLQVIADHIASWKRQKRVPTAIQLPADLFDAMMESLYTEQGDPYRRWSLFDSRSDGYVFGMRVLRADVSLPEPIYEELPPLEKARFLPGSKFYYSKGREQ